MTESPPHSRDEDQYDELVVSIEASEGVFSLLIAVCDDRATRERIIQRYEQELAPDILADRLTLDSQEPSLRAAIANWVETHPDEVEHNRRVVLTITGADELRWINLQADASEKPPLEKFLGYLQWTREAIGQFRYPIVLWVTNRVVKLISRKAPDFWSWRKGVFRFSSDEVPNLIPKDLFSAKAVITPPIEFESTEEDFPLAVEELQDLIAKTEAQQGTASPLLATLYTRMGQAYARRIAQGESSDLSTDRRLAAQAFNRALHLQETLGLDSARMATLTDLGNFYFAQGRFSEALQCYQQSLQLARQISDRNGDARSLGNMGSVYDALGQYPQAIKFHQQQLEIARQLGDRQGQANALNNLGNAYKSLGQYSEAIEFHQQQLEIARQIGDCQGEANALGNLGSAYDFLEQYPQAIEFYQRQLDIAQQIGDRKGEASSLMGFGNAYYALGQYLQAIEFYQQSLEIKRQLGDLQGEANSLSNLGSAYRSLGQVQQAIEFYQQSLEIQRQIGDRQGEATSLGNLGSAYAALRQYQQAISFHRQSLELKRQIGDLQGVSTSLGNLGNAYDFLGQTQQAIEFLQQSLEISRQIGDRRGAAITWFNLGLALEKIEQPEQALSAFKAARSLYLDLGLQQDVQKCDEAIARLEPGTGDAIADLDSLAES